MEGVLADGRVDGRVAGGGVGGWVGGCAHVLMCGWRVGGITPIRFIGGLGCANLYDPVNDLFHVFVIVAVCWCSFGLQCSMNFFVFCIVRSSMEFVSVLHRCCNG